MSRRATKQERCDGCDCADDVDARCRCAPGCCPCVDERPVLLDRESQVTS